MSIQHLPNTASIAEAEAVVREHGHVIIDNLASHEIIDQLVAEMQPYVEQSPVGERPWGYKTRRTGRLMARSPVARDLVRHPLMLGLVKSLLSHAPGIQLAVTDMITLDPGAEAQPLHRDELAFGNFPFPPDYEVAYNVIWALTDFTEENGATRIVPGSHKNPLVDHSGDATVPAEMTKGSVIIFSAKIWHGGGSNVSTGPRRAQSFNFTVNWLRQEENQFIACPPKTARTLPEDLLKLMGYETIYGVGHAGGQTDPLAALYEDA